MSKNHSSRRDVLRVGATLGAAALLGSSLLRSTNALAASQVVAGLFPGLWEDAFNKVVVPGLQKKGIELVISPALASDQLGKTMAAAGKPPYDALLMSPGQIAVAKKNNLIVKVDPSQIPNWNQLADPSFQDEWGPAMTVQLDGIAYNPDKVRKPKGYADLLSPDFYGKVALAGFQSNSAVMAYVQLAKAFGGSEDDLSPLWPKLKDYLPHIGAIAQDMNDQQSLFRQGEIAVMIASTNNVSNMKSLGVSCEFVLPEEGAPATPVNINLTKGASDPKAVHEYINIVLSQEVQTALQEPPLENFPVNKNVPISAAVGKFMQRADLGKYTYLNWGKINDHLPEWTTTFNKVVAGG